MSLADTYDVPWQPCSKPSWPAVQAKFAFDIVLGKMLQPESERPTDTSVPYLKAQNVQWGNVISNDLLEMWASEKEVEQLNLKINDLLVCEGGEVGRSATVNEELPQNCIFQNALHRVRPSRRGNTRYLYYCLKMASEAGWFDVICNRATIAHFTVEKFRELKIHLPLTDQQEVIANYLDRETAHIDDLIAEKERMLALLEEKRAALISQAVTRGLDPDVPRKPSGLDWLGHIPAHWDIERAKNVFSVRDERSETGDEELLTVSHITGVTSRAEKEVYMFKADDMTGYKRCYPNDLVINTLWAWMGAMGVSPLAGIISPDYHVYESKGLLLPEFVELLCRSKPFVAEVNRWSKGVWSSRLRLYPENFFEMRLPIPSEEDQKEIVRVVEEEGQKSRELVAALKDSMTLLKERRSALITAAVTGQIDPKDMAA